MIDLGVAVVVVDDGRVLLVEREDSDVWCLPGGGVDDGESVAAAAVREVEEESGILVRLERLVGIYSRPGWSSHQVIFFGRRAGGNLQMQTGETNAAGFFDPRDMPLIVPWHRQPIDDALQGVGGSAAWKLDWVWPFPPGMSRGELYGLRDRSGLSRQEFFRQQVFKLGTDGEQREV